MANGHHRKDLFNRMPKSLRWIQERIVGPESLDLKVLIATTELLGQNCFTSLNFQYFLLSHTVAKSGYL